MRIDTDRSYRFLGYAAWLTQGTLGSSLNQISRLTDGTTQGDPSLGFDLKIPLRTMPLGASITWGYRSSDGNGYRKDLREQLVAAGAIINMVGSRTNGDMLDNSVEGWPGYQIEQVHAKAKIAIPKYLPNLVLVNVGTNDVSSNNNLTGVGDRMTDMLDDIYKSSPPATVILSTLVVRRDPDDQSRVLAFNEQMRAVALTFQAKKRRLILVDMQSSNGPTVADLVDGTHPNNLGYAKMAKIWFAGIQAAGAKGYVTAPLALDGHEKSSSNGKCKKGVNVKQAKFGNQDDEDGAECEDAKV